SHRIKKEFSKTIGLIFILNIIYYGLLYYVFKYYAAPLGMGGASFLVNTWIIAIAILFVVAVFKGGKTFWSPDHGLGNFMKTEIFGKFFDALGTVLGFKALAYVAVSQVNAMYAFQPIIVLLLVIIFQKYLRFNEKEDLKRGDFTAKVLLALVVCLGGFLVS
ncbi:MAG TPA: hypothetical protein VMR73_00985, partial [Candidatus Paceibacterota bacterium]|nr:hypothetical protein [Candidatus Paceibacterota bacterium]